MRKRTEKAAKGFISFLLSVVMVVGLSPTYAYADDGDGGIEPQSSSGTVYLTISSDNSFVTSDGINADTTMSYVAIDLEEVSKVNLDDYGYGDYWYDADEDGNYETTALQLFLYASEQYYSGGGSSLVGGGSPGSFYIKSFFGHDENFIYYENGDYPLEYVGWGATCDHIALSDGDFIDVAMFTSWGFYQDTAAGMHFFTAGDSDNTIVHSYTATTGEAMDLSLIRVYSDMNGGQKDLAESDYTVNYGKTYGTSEGTVTTDSNGKAQVTFPTAGTWYLWVEAGYGIDNDYGNYVSTPARVPVTVTDVSPAISTTELASATVGDEYSATIEASGTVPTFSATGLPESLSIDATTGKITGTPAAGTGGEYTVTVSATNSASIDTKELSLIVNEAPTVTGDTSFTGAVGQAFEAQLAASGYPEEFSWYLDGGSELPAGLSMDASTGKISGTPTAKGTYTFNVSVANSVGVSDATPITITINELPQITTTELPSGAAGTAYTATLAATGDPAVSVWEISDGSLPAGLSLDAATGEISGTPTEAGTFTFSVKASSDAGSDTKELSIEIAGSAPAFTTTALAGAKVNEAYEATIEVTGTPTPTVSVSGLPEGLSFDATTNKISGTPTATGEYKVALSAENLVGKADAELELSVTEGITITTTELPDATVDATYTAAVAATGYPAPTLSVSGLPAGLSFDAETNTISGTPTESGEFTVTVTATNSVETKSVEFELAVYGSPTVTTTKLADGFVGTAYSASIEATGYPAPTFLLSGSLPDGLSLGSDGKISGTPAAAGTYTFKVIARNSQGASAQTELSITIYEPLQITTDATLPVAHTYNAYSYQLESNYDSGVTWSKSSGTSWVKVSSAGVVSFTRNYTGTGTFVVKATASNGSTTTKSFTVKVASEYNTGSTYYYQVGIDGQVAVSSGTTQNGKPVSNLSFYASRSNIVSIADLGGKDYRYDSDGDGSYNVSALNVIAYQLSKYYSDGLNGGMVLDDASEPGAMVFDKLWGVENPTLVVSVNGVAQLNDDGTPASPDRIILSKNDFIDVDIYSSAEAVNDAATHRFVNDAGSALFSTNAYTGEALSLTLNEIATDGTSSAAASHTVSYGTTYETADGTVTTGEDGKASITFSEDGTYYVWADGENSTSGPAIVTVTVTTKTAPTITTTQSSVKGVLVGTSYSVTLKASGVPSTFTWGLADGSALPDGLTLNASTGKISGTPTTAGSYTFTVTCSNGIGDPATQEYTINVTADKFDKLEGTAYVTLSYDEPNGKFLLSNKTDYVEAGVPMWRVAIDLAEASQFDPTEHGWSGTFSSDKDGDGSQDLTAARLMCYVADHYYGDTNGDGKTNDGFSYTTWVTDIWEKGISGNVIYELNGVSTGAAGGVYISDGDSWNMALFSKSNWYFYDDAYAGFHYFMQTQDAATTYDSTKITYEGTATTGQEAEFYFAKERGGMSTSNTDQANYTLYYGKSYDTGDNSTATGSVVTDENGTAKITFPQPGTWYVWADGGYGKTATTFRVSSAAMIKVTVNAKEKPTITTETLPDAENGTAYSAAIEGTGDPAPTFTVTEGELPTGLSLASDGKITGTPTMPGNYTFTVTAGNTEQDATSKQFSIKVDGVPTVTTSSLDDGKVGDVYSAQLEAASLDTTLSWKLADGSTLPAGLTLSTDGKISGTPTQSGNYEFSVICFNTFGDSAVAKISLCVTGTPSVKTTSLENAMATVAYEAQLEAYSASECTWYVDDPPALPSGITLSSSGLLSGTTTQVGTYKFSVRVSNSDGMSEAQELTLVVEGSAPAILTKELAPASTSAEYAQDFNVSGTPHPTVTVTGLPDGMSYDADQGKIIGTPTLSGVYTVTATATNGIGLASKEFTLTVSGKPTITSDTTIYAKVGEAFSEKIEVAAYPAANFWFTGTDILPAGVSVSSSGIISGVVSETGTWTFNVVATNSEGSSDTTTFTLVGYSDVSVQSFSFSTWRGGRSSTQYVWASGSPLPDEASATGLPDGVEITQIRTVNGRTRIQISGTPTQGGVYEVTVTASNGASEASASATLTVRPSTAGGTEVSSDWYNFRNSDVNIGLTSAATPIDADTTELVWAKQLGSGWSNSPSVQIIVDDALVVMSNKKIYKLDLQTGEELASGDLVAAPNWGYTPPTYADGKIFCPLSGGRIQALDADTLESLWVYKDPSGGQALSPIVYSDGYVYTGFWNGEAKAANYVCVDSSDYDTSATDEAKTATWSYSSVGGFYWAGGVAVGDYIVVGTDDGASDSTGDSKMLAFNKITGEVVSSLTLEGMGDQRSSVSYDAASGTIFFTTKGGYICKASVNATTGELSNLVSINTEGQSTSTPLYYKGYLYVGAGNALYGGEKSAKLYCLNASTLDVVFAASLKGYPQCSPLLSTAYEDSGYLYVYSTYNSTPGGITMLKVKNNPTSAEDVEVVEIYDAAGYSEYCIASLIAGKDGTLYYKNDSGNVLAVGTRAAASITTEELPEASRGVEYSAALEASGIPSEFTWSLADGSSLPDGLALTADGVISGTPTATAGSYSFDVVCSNGFGDAATKTFTIDLTDKPVITTDTLPNATYSVAYEAQLEAKAADSATDISWFLDSASTLPAGLSFSSDGTISGTPTETGDFTITVTASCNGQISDAAELSLHVDGAAPEITTTELADAVAGEAYSAAVAVTGTPAATITVTGLPDGLSYDAETAAITGTPAAGTGGAYEVTITATNGLEPDATATLALTVNEAPAIATTELPAATVGSEYSATIEVAGYPVPQLMVSADLPDGLSVSGNTISGTPEASGEFTVSAFARNSVGTSEQAKLSLTVLGPLEITTDSLPSAYAKSEYSYQLESNYSDGVTWEKTSGASWINVSSDGLVNFTRNYTGTGKLTVKATASNGSTATKDFTIPVVNKYDYNKTYYTTAAKDGKIIFSDGSSYSGQPINNLSHYASSTNLIDLDSVGLGDYKYDSDDNGTNEVTALNIICYQLEKWSSIGATDGIKLAATSQPGAMVFEELWGVKNATLVVSVNGVAQLNDDGTPVSPDRVVPPARALVDINIYSSAEAAADATLHRFVDEDGDNLFKQSSGIYSGEEATYTLNQIGTKDGAAEQTAAAGYNVSYGTDYGTALGTATTGEDGTAKITFPDAGTYYVWADGAKNANGNVVSGPALVTVTVKARTAATITTTSIDNAAAGSSYSVTLSASGDPKTFTWGLAEGSSLPEGLELDSSTGVISGTPTTSGTYNFTVTCTNGIGEANAQALTLKVVADKYKQMDGYVYYSLSEDGVFYTSKGKDPGKTLAYIPVSLKDVAAIDLDDYGLGKYKKEAQDADANYAYETTLMQLYVYACINWSENGIDDMKVTGYAHSSYMSKYFGHDENLNYYYNGDYPMDSTLGAGMGATSDWISLSPGDFTEIGMYSDWSFYGDPKAGFHYFVKSDVGDVVDKEDIALEYAATAGEPLDVNLVRKPYTMGSGSTAYYKEANYDIYYGSAYNSDDQAVVTTDDNGTAQITFDEPGTYYVWAFGDYGDWYPDSVVNNPTIAKVTVSLSSYPAVKTTELGTAATGAEFSAQLEAYTRADGEACTWYLVAGSSLPDGLTLSESGAVSGTPTKAGEYSFEVVAASDDGVSAASAVSISVVDPAKVVTAELADATMNSEYSAAIEVSGTDATVSVSGLPAGLSFDEQAGAITGTPTASGEFDVSVTAENSVSQDSAILKLVVREGVGIATAELADATAGELYAADIVTSGYPVPEVTVTGLPQGLSYDAESGKISGTPAEGGEFTVTVTAANANETASKDLVLKVFAEPTISSTTLASAYVGSEYSGAIETTGYPAPTFLVSGSLPEGLSIAADGTITGTPTTAGSYTFKVIAVNSLGASEQVALSLVVNQTPEFTTESLPTAFKGKAYSAKVEATGYPTDQIKYSKVSGPEWLNVSEDGTVSGTPTENATGTVTVKAEIEGVGSAEKTFELKVVDKYEQLTGTAYISVSTDGKFPVSDGNVSDVVMDYVAIDLSKLSAMDLADYGLDAFNYDADGDGSFEVTQLQLMLYALEQYYSGGATSGGTFSTSSYGLYITKYWGISTTYITYALNGTAPVDSAGNMLTADTTPIADGDWTCVNVFSDTSIYGDANAADHYFVDAQGGSLVHSVEAYAGEAFELQLNKVVYGYNATTWATEVATSPEPNYAVSWGREYGTAEGTATTGSDGKVSITLPSDGTWYVWVDGIKGATHPDSYVSTPALVTVNVAKAEVEPSVVRLSGYGALDTMVAIVNEGDFETGGTAILVTDGSFYDALAASSIAGMASAPVLMTDSNTLSAQTEQLLGQLKPSKLIVCGGSNAVSDSVALAAAKAAGIEVSAITEAKPGAQAISSDVTLVRIWGDDAHGTAVAISQQAASVTGKAIGKTAFVCVDSSYVDALSISPYAYATGSPIFLTASSQIDSETLNAIAIGGFDEVYIVGGELAITPAVETALKAAGVNVADRLSGENGIETSQKVAEFEIARGMSANGMAVATSEGYWDALCGAALCGRKNSVLVLASTTDTTWTAVDALIQANKDDIEIAYILGGAVALPEDLKTHMEALLKGE